MKKTVTICDKFSRLKDVLWPFPVQMKEKKMLTCSVEWGHEHSFLKSRTFSDDIIRGWIWLDLHIRLPAFCRASSAGAGGGDRRSLLGKALSSFRGSGTPSPRVPPGCSWTSARADFSPLHVSLPQHADFLCTASLSPCLFRGSKILDGSSSLFLYGARCLQPP